MSDHTGGGIFKFSTIQDGNVNSTFRPTTDKIITTELEPGERDCSGYLIFMYIVLGTLIAVLGVTGRTKINVQYFGISEKNVGYNCSNQSSLIYDFSY